MCVTCGCGQDSQSENHHHNEFYAHNHEHQHEHIHTDVYNVSPNNTLLKLEQSILAKNDDFAKLNLSYFNSEHKVALNLVSSPGAGKTSLLEQTIKHLAAKHSLVVIEGDQHTSLDTKRIEMAGAYAYQINTGKSCHLDAHMVNHALPHLPKIYGGFVFIENVGNLICPSLFDLGEHLRVVVISVTEGEDKPLKYPDMFYSAHLVIINKIDLLPHIKFDIEQLEDNIKQINHKTQILRLSAATTDGISHWTNWLLLMQGNIFPPS